MNMLEMALSTPDSASELIVHAEKCIQYIEFFIKVCIIVVRNSLYLNIYVQMIELFLIST